MNTTNQNERYIYIPENPDQDKKQMSKLDNTLMS